MKRAYVSKIHNSNGTECSECGILSKLVLMVGNQILCPECTKQLAADMLARLSPLSVHFSDVDMDLPIDRLGLSTRVLNVLETEYPEVKTAGALSRIPGNALMCRRGFGHGCMNEVIDKLRAVNLRMEMRSK